MTTSVPADDGLFPFDGPAPVKAGPVEEWTRVHSKTARCDRCQLEQAEARGHAPRPQVAKWRHRWGDGSELLCYPHAAAVRAEAAR